MKFPRVMPPHPRLPEEAGIGYVDTTDLPPLTYPEISAISQKVEDDEPIPVNDIDRFLETDMDERPSLLSRYLGRAGQAAPAAAALAASYVTKNALHMYPDLQDQLGDMTADQAFAAQSLWEYLPLFGDAAENDSVHWAMQVPGGLIALAVSSAALQTVVRQGSKSFDRRHKKQQDILRERKDAGTQKFDLRDSDNATIAVVGHGASLSGTMASQVRHRLVQISFDPVKGVNVVLPVDGSSNDTIEALERADIAHARSVIFFPDATAEAIFPSTNYNPADYDISVDRFSRYVERIDAIRDDLPMAVLGNRRQLAEYDSVGQDREHHFDSEYLGERVEELNRGRKVPIEMIDQTERVLADLYDTYEEPMPLELAGSKTGVADYKDGFLYATGDRWLPDPDAPAGRVFYGKRDRSFMSRANPGDRAIMHDAGSRDLIIERRGLDPDHVILVPTAIAKALKPYLGELE